MDKDILIQTVSRLMIEPKGILAIDESMPTCNKRFEKLGVPTTEEKRRDYRDLLITAPDIEKYISGYILFDETVRQKTKDGRSFIAVLQERGIEPGIKVDGGLADFPDHEGEKLTKGIDGLENRLKEYAQMKLTFTKWRAVYTISDKTPSEDCMRENARLFAKYAALCQENGLVPIVEPEVLIDGNYSIEKCYEVIAKNLQIVFSELKSSGVFISGMILKTSMTLSGKDSGKKSTPEQVADMTLKCLQENVPVDIGGIVFLSGGQGDLEATLNLNAMHQKGPLPWPLTFSYGRAIQNGALQSWAKNPKDTEKAQTFLLEAARNNSLASVGKYCA